MARSVSYDVVCAGPVTLDVTLAGLDALPQPGEERFGTELVFSPGAIGTVAVGAARLGLRTAIISPRGRDLFGDYVASLVEGEGVAWIGPDAARAPISFVFPLGEERAIASYEPVGSMRAAAAGNLSAKAFVAGEGCISGAPEDAEIYVMTSFAAVPWPDGPPASLSAARTFFANEAEANRLTRAADAEDAVRQLGAYVPTAVVTMGAAGALACRGGEVVRVDAPTAPAVDTTGAGDLFAAAFLWADLAAAPLADCLAWATLYATLSIGVVGALAGATGLDDLLAEGRSRGLTPPL